VADVYFEAVILDFILGDERSSGITVDEKSVSNIGEVVAIAGKVEVCL
jgi:hypothetical protein